MGDEGGPDPIHSDSRRPQPRERFPITRDREAASRRHGWTLATGRGRHALVAASGRAARVAALEAGVALGVARARRTGLEERARPGVQHGLRGVTTRQAVADGVDLAAIARARRRVRVADGTWRREAAAGRGAAIGHAETADAAGAALRGGRAWALAATAAGASAAATADSSSAATPAGSSSAAPRSAAASAPLTTVAAAGYAGIAAAASALIPTVPATVSPRHGGSRSAAGKERGEKGHGENSPARRSQHAKAYQRPDVESPG